MSKTETVFVLMGSNLGDRARNLSLALNKLQELPGLEVVATSAIYISAAVDMPEGAPSFMNQVVKTEFQYLPSELLSGLELIEKNLGRTGKGLKEPRPIDLDILLFGDQIVETETLSVPHRELLNRHFALVPLLQIDPNIIHPVTKSPIADFLDSEKAAEVVVYQDHVARCF
jgi:2-amino-4-hydroxy-6-hydroxymethyldihydropteridine diphosphokinase